MRFIKIIQVRGQAEQPPNRIILMNRIRKQNTAVGCRKYIIMQIKIFTIPIGAEETQIEELNHFLRANKIIVVKRELAAIDGRDCWSFCITDMLQNKQIEPEKPRVGSA